LESQKSAQVLWRVAVAAATAIARRNKGVWSSLGSWSLYSTILVILLVVLGETLGDILGDTLGDILMAQV
jgi:hypothetical protein